MSVQFIDALEGKEFVPTYIGRFLKSKFHQNPSLKKRIPRRWLTLGYVTEEVIKNEQADSGVNK